MRISDWSSDVCSSDLPAAHHRAAEDRKLARARHMRYAEIGGELHVADEVDDDHERDRRDDDRHRRQPVEPVGEVHRIAERHDHERREHDVERSEEHTSELQSLMRISYAVSCLKKKKQHFSNKDTEKRINS